MPADSVVTEAVTDALRNEVDVRDHKRCRGYGHTRRQVVARFCRASLTCILTTLHRHRGLVIASGVAKLMLVLAMVYGVN